MPTPDLRELAAPIAGETWAVDPDDRDGMEWNDHIVLANEPDMRVAFMSNSPLSNARAAYIAAANPAAVIRLLDERDALRAALSASVGYLLNAKIDLETGATKATAIRTIEGGIARARAALSQSTPQTEAEI